MVKGLTAAASIWTVAAVGLAVGGGLYLAASTSTVIILIILAGIKPLEEAYRSRNQSCQPKIEVDNGSLTPEVRKGGRKMVRTSEIGTLTSGAAATTSPKH